LLGHPVSVPATTQEVYALLTCYQVLRIAITDAIEATGGLDPGRGSFTIALNAARDLLTQAADVIAGTVIDLIGAIGRRVPDNLPSTGGYASAPASSNARSPNSRHEDPTSAGAAAKPPSASASLLRPDLDTPRPGLTTRPWD
jgi:hypothetical protein